MKAGLDVNGYLVIIAENECEDLTLGMWRELNTNKVIEGDGSGVRLAIYMSDEGDNEDTVSL